jgi:hypothetical protein
MILGGDPKTLELKQRGIEFEVPAAVTIGDIS